MFLKGVLGEGGFGKVFLACAGDRCKLPSDYRLVMKIQPVREQKFERELEFTKLASDLGVGPYMSFWCGDIRPELVEVLNLDAAERFAVIVLDRWDVDLAHLKPNLIRGSTLRSTRNRKTVENILREKINRLHTAGVIHADLLPKNVLLRVDPDFNITDVCLTDYGISFYTTDASELVKVWTARKWRYYTHADPYNNFRYDQNGRRYEELVKALEAGDESSRLELVKWIGGNPYLIDQFILLLRFW